MDRGIRHLIKRAVIIGVCAECILVAPLIFFGEAAATCLPLLVYLQAPGALPLIELLRSTEVRNLAGRLPWVPVLVVVQLAAICIQVVMFSLRSEEHTS